MKSLEKDIDYKIHWLNLKLHENIYKMNCELSKNGYTEKAKRYSRICKSINKQLTEIKNDLQNKYNSLEFNAINIREIENISTLLIYLKDFDESVLVKVKKRISELNDIKEQANKRLDFKEASIARQESHDLLKYYNQNKYRLNK